MRRRRLPRDRFDGLALPVRRRVVDADAVNRVRVGFCEKCGRSDGTAVPHHITTRGSGGGDVPLNLINLCVRCHDAAHRGLIPKAELLRLARLREETP